MHCLSRRAICHFVIIGLAGHKPFGGGWLGVCQDHSEKTAGTPSVDFNQVVAVLIWFSVHVNYRGVGRFLRQGC